MIDLTGSVCPACGSPALTLDPAADPPAAMCNACGRVTAQAELPPRTLRVDELPDPHPPATDATPE